MSLIALGLAIEAIGYAFKGASYFNCRSIIPEDERRELRRVSILPTPIDVIYSGLKSLRH